MECILLLKGLWSVAALCREGKTCSFFETFINDLGANYNAEKDRLFSLLKQTAKGGTEGISSDRLKSVGDGLLEFRTKSLRLFFFKDEGKIVLLCNGYIKKSQKANERDLGKARALKQEYDRAKKAKLIMWKDTDYENVS